MTTSIGRRLAIAAAVTIGAGGAPCAAQCLYEMIVVEGPRCAPFGDPANSRPQDLDATGRFVGYYNHCDRSSFNEAFIWSLDTGRVDLPRLPGSLGAVAFGISSRGDIVGHSQSPYRAVLWRGGEVINLGVPPEGNWSQAHAINSRGRIVGWWADTIDGPGGLACYWDEDLTLVDLGQALGALFSRAYDVNEAGDIVGERRINGGDATRARAFLWRDGEVIDIGVVPGALASIALAVNDAGAVVGYSAGDGWANAFLWQDGVLTDLGRLPGSDRCFARDVNDRGDIVGYCMGQGGVIWRDGVMTRINDLLEPEAPRPVVTAKAINRSGKIAGVTEDGDSYILTPRPILAGDADCDGVVGLHDLLEVLSNWGRCLVCTEDLDRNRWVDSGDVEIVLSNWTN